MLNNTELTKNNNKVFADKDYKKLHRILNNEHSELKHYKYDGLTAKQCENQYQVDAVSGATSTEYDLEYINGAIKTTYTLWHVAHGNIATEIRTLNDIYCNQQISDDNISLHYSYDKASTVAKYLFINSLIASKVAISDNDVALLLADLSTDNYAIFSAITNILNLKCSSKEKLYDNITPYLDGSQFKQVESYNTLEKNGKFKVLKQITLDFHNTAF